MTIRPPITISPSTGAILFDLDGTLADTDPLHAEAWRIVAERRFGITFSWEQYRDACLVGDLSPREFLARLGADVGSIEIAQEKARVFQGMLRRGLTLAAGVERLVAEARSAGVPIAIVSSGSRRSVDSFTCALWPGAPPTIVVSREDTESQKPSPAPYLHALQQLGRVASACVAVEDTFRGLLAAKRAGLRTIKVSQRTDGPTVEADITVDELEDLSVSISIGGALEIAVNIET